MDKEGSLGGIWNINTAGNRIWLNWVSRPTRPMLTRPMPTVVI